MTYRVFRFTFITKQTLSRILSTEVVISRIGTGVYHSVLHVMSDKMSDARKCLHVLKFNLSFLLQNIKYEYMLIQLKIPLVPHIHNFSSSKARTEDNISPICNTFILHLTECITIINDGATKPVLLPQRQMPVAHQALF